MEILCNIVIHIMPDKIPENGQHAIWFRDTEQIEVVGKLGLSRRINRMIENGKKMEEKNKKLMGEIDDLWTFIRSIRTNKKEEEDAYCKKEFECQNLEMEKKELQRELAESNEETLALKCIISSISNIVKESDKIAGWVKNE